MNKFKNYIVFVDNLPYNMNSNWLKNIFKFKGDIVDVYFSFKKRKFTENIFGFVRFRCEEDGARAISKLDGKMINSNLIKVKWARDPKNGYSRGFQRKTPLPNESKEMY